MKLFRVGICAGAACLASAAFPPLIVMAVAQRTLASESLPVPAGETFSRPVTLRLTEVSVKRAVDAIAAQAAVQIQYRETFLSEVKSPVTLHASKMPLGIALTRVLAGTKLQPVETAPGLITIKPFTDNAPLADGVVTGRVVNAKTKQPVPGVLVTIGNATSGVTTGEDGAFRLTASPGEQIVHARRLGYGKQEQRVTVRDGQSVNVEFSLDLSTSVLNEVIVTGTVAATERKALPTPITVITADEIERRGITRVDELFRGVIPGVVALERGSETYDRFYPGQMAKSEVYVRGSSTLDGAPNPLKTYIDGVEMVDPSYLGTIDPKSIERIEVITGPQAATLYGSGAMGGVMQIFTKRGSGSVAPDFRVGITYGMLENNLSNSRAPSHNHVVDMTGGNGPAFSYAANASYLYTGQWRPKLFNETGGASVGATHVRGPVTVSGSVMLQRGRNGTYYNDPASRALRQAGIYGAGMNLSVEDISGSTTNTMSLNIDYRALSQWQHHLTVGRSQTTLDVEPKAAPFSYDGDTLMRQQSVIGQRLSASYNTSYRLEALQALSSTFTLGANGSWSNSTSIMGYGTSGKSPSWAYPTVSRSKTEGMGGFGSWQLGVLDRLFTTVGVRAEYNPYYGRDHKIDWTPTYGATYTIEQGELSIKLLGSYGRATRAPLPSMRSDSVATIEYYNPSRFQLRFANPDLTPEYSRGPQGGIELYYGNLGSLTLNHYQQRVSDLIQLVAVDSVLAENLYAPGYFEYVLLNQYQNVASIRQYGWDATGTINVQALTLSGTYSWSDSRITSVRPELYTSYQTGQIFQGVPTHTANVSVSYAHGGTSLLLSMNYIGSILSMTQTNYVLNLLPLNARLKMYLDRMKTMNVQRSRSGYVKSNLTASQRLASWASLTLNITNLGDSYGSESTRNDAVLGRQTLVGMTIRFPKR